MSLPVNRTSGGFPGVQGATAVRGTALRAEWRLLVLLGVVFALASCGHGFRPRDFANPEALFRASLLQFQQQKWENAQAGFEQLSNDLSAQDPLLAPV
ncbi:MAG: hypothetical protein ABI120_16860, partial [Gemmatimonadaceae bacterium]